MFVSKKWFSFNMFPLVKNYLRILIIISFSFEQTPILIWPPSVISERDRFRADDERLKCIANIKRRKGKGRAPADGITRWLRHLYSRSSPTIFRLLLVRCGRGSARQTLGTGRLAWARNRRLEIEEFLWCIACACDWNATGQKRWLQGP